MKVKISQSCLTLCDPTDCSAWNSPGQKTGVGSLSLLQGIYPTQGSNPGLPHCRQILYQLSHKGSPRILEWVAYAFSRGSSRPSNQTGVFSHAQVDSLPTVLSRKPSMIDYFQSFVFTLLHDHQVTHIKYHSALVTLIGISLYTSFPLNLQHVVLYF